MGGNVEAIKERLDIAEVIGGYVPLQKAGANFKAKCPFHNEKTASFFISPARQSYYCFGCGAKGDIFTFVEEMEGVDFKDALKSLAERAGVKLTYERAESRSDKDRLLAALEEATSYFETNLGNSKEAKKYLASRGVSEESFKAWRLGFAPDEWRGLREHLHKLRFDDDVLLRAGLIKKSEEAKSKEPYDVFRGRIIFPISDARGEVIAFSGRAMGDVEPKYLNSPDTPLFSKSETLYGFDKAREDIRKKDYAILVEGQMDLVLSHQAGVKNTVASSGTAFTEGHLGKLSRISPRIILAFDADSAGKKAAEKSAALALTLGMEVKIAKLPEGKDPADLVGEDPEAWKLALRSSKHAIEIFLDETITAEPDRRRLGKVVEKRILPLIALLGSSMERSHFVSLIAKRTGIRDEVIWDDLKKIKTGSQPAEAGANPEVKPRRSRVEELEEVLSWLKEDPEDADLLRQRSELEKLVKIDELDEQISTLRLELAGGGETALEKIASLSRERDEVRRGVL